MFKMKLLLTLVLLQWLSIDLVVLQEINYLSTNFKLTNPPFGLLCSLNFHVMQNSLPLIIIHENIVTQPYPDNSH
jgi:hypothetical protein